MLPLVVGEIEDQYEPHRVAVEGGRQRAEPLLPGRVPQLQLDPLAPPGAVQRGVRHTLLSTNFTVQLTIKILKNSKNLPKIDADRRDVSVAEGAVDELAKEARLADARIAQEEKLEEVVILHVARNEEVATCYLIAQSHYLPALLRL